MNELIKHDLALNCALIGVDEVGRGCLAGPVYAGAIHFDLTNWKPEFEYCLKLVNDSKKVKPALRQVLSEDLKKFCNFGIGIATCDEINEFGILPSTLLAMKRAILQITKTKKNKNHLLLIDGISKIKDIDLEQKTIKKGDSLSWHIAAASIIAKTARDEFMRELALMPEYKNFAWHKNVGYGTKEHCTALIEHGATKEHRKKFIRKILSN